MSTTVAVHPDALDEIEAAAAWYESRQPGLGFEFVAEIERLFAQISEAPERFPLAYEGDPSRRAVSGRFPYIVIFDVSAARIVVMAVAHSKRRPGYWSKRR